MNVETQFLSLLHFAYLCILLLYCVMQKLYQEHLLDNGLRIVHLPSDSPVAYCGFAVNVGARDELVTEFGMAHFVEHLLFKGTNKRNSWHILNRMETVGGELNAYTSKEETFVYSMFLESHFERATELLCDLVFSSRFPATEIEKEVDVILDEINSYKDNPSELIYDEFENRLFAGHELGHNILGTEESLTGFTTDNGLSFVSRFYSPSNMVFFSMGRTNFQRIVKWVNKYAGHVPDFTCSCKRVCPSLVSGSQFLENHDTHQSHVIIGARGYDLHHDKRLALYLLNNILGGPGMNSRLNLILRERHGYVYSVESTLTSYTDTGLIAIYFGSDPKNRDKCISLIQKEIVKLRNNALTSQQFAAAKKQLVGQIGVSVDNRESLFLALGKSYLHYNRFESLDDVYRRLDSLSVGILWDVANEIFDESQIFSLIFE